MGQQDSVILGFGFERGLHPLLQTARSFPTRLALVRRRSERLARVPQTARCCASATRVILADSGSRWRRSTARSCRSRGADPRQDHPSDGCARSASSKCRLYGSRGLTRFLIRLRPHVAVPSGAPIRCRREPALVAVPESAGARLWLQPDGPRRPRRQRRHRADSASSAAERPPGASLSGWRSTRGREHGLTLSGKRGQTRAVELFAAHPPYPGARQRVDHVSPAKPTSAHIGCWLHRLDLDSALGPRTVSKIARLVDHIRRPALLSARKHRRPRQKPSRSRRRRDPHDAPATRGAGPGTAATRAYLHRPPSSAEKKS
jgi:hypothetical protein